MLSSNARLALVVKNRIKEFKITQEAVVAVVSQVLQSASVGTVFPASVSSGSALKTTGS